MINVLKFNESIPIDIPSGFAVFCDMDGTLVDTDYANYLSYRRAIIEATCETHDVEFTADRLSREGLKKRFPSLTASQLEVIVTLKEKYFTKFISETKLNVALAQLIIKHCEKTTIVLVTCCREKRAKQVLEYHKLIGCFARLVCLECLPQRGASNKYENAIKLVQARKKALFIFENDSGCIEEAIQAGVPKSNIYRISIEPSRTS
jgi:beta-phosphoglucomutase-like phosphatase (HAD superfamily)